MHYTVIASLCVMISLWEYCMFFYLRGLLPYRDGYNIFSLLQWIICSVALVHIFGWLGGIAAVFVAVGFLPYVTHFTLGILYSWCFGEDPRPAIALFSIMIWVSAGLTATSLFL